MQAFISPLLGFVDPDSWTKGAQHLEADNVSLQQPLLETVAQKPKGVAASISNVEGCHNVPGANAVGRSQTQAICNGVSMPRV